MVKFQVLAMVLLVGACDSGPQGPAAPAPTPAPVAKRAAPAVSNASSVAPVASQANPSPEASARLDPSGVLDEDERRLLEADDATLTKDDRVARARAQRKLVMADPEHPLQPVLARVEAEVASGEARSKALERWSGRSAFPPQDDVEAAPPRG